MSVGELRQRLASEAAPFLLDVREPEEMVDGCIAGSVNIPMNEVERRLDELPADRDIVVICHLGERSGYVTRKLHALGYDGAVSLRGGMDAWLADTGFT